MMLYGLGLKSPEVFCQQFSDLNEVRRLSAE